MFDETHGRGAHATNDPALPPTARSAGANDASDKTVQGESPDNDWPISLEKLRRKLAVPSQGRLYYLRYALKMGWTIDQIYDLTKIDRWFLAQMRELVEFEDKLRDGLHEADILPSASAPLSDREIKDTYPAVSQLLRQAKQWGYSNVQLAACLGVSPETVRRALHNLRIQSVYKLVDTCAAEFEAATPYYYSTCETPFTQNGATVVEDEIRLTQKPKVIILGGGPNRIGQGIEFDYCCVHAAFAMKEIGFESVMVNSNPETVSTDYDTSDLLFFEPLTHEDVLNICERLNGGPFSPTGNQQPATSNLVKGVIVQFGGQTPLNLAKGLKDAGVPILGTTVESIDAAGDREQFRDLLQKLGLKQPENGIARNMAEAREIARRIGYPVLVRPSFVLGGRAMEIVSDETQLNYYMANAIEASGTGAATTDSPILIDKFLDAATEVDVDCIADFAANPSPSPSTLGEGRGEGSGQAIIAGVMEHIEEAGIHSGDSACALPPFSLSAKIVQRLKDQTRALAKALRVRGLMNVQYAIRDNDIYVIEVNPRASRTIPFVSKATGIPWAKLAAKVMAGKSLADLGVTEQPNPTHMSVKEAVFPFSKFPGVDVILGPEMRSTGEVMGIDQNFPMAYAKAQIAAGTVLPTKGTVFISLRSADKSAIIDTARIIRDCGFTIVATAGTRDELLKNGIEARLIPKLSEGRPNIKDLIKNGQVQLIINTPTRKGPHTDEGQIRAMAVLHKIPMITTLTAAHACALAIQALQSGDWGVRPLQSYFQPAIQRS